MTVPSIYGGLGVRGNGLAQLGLAGPQIAQPYSFPAMPSMSLPYVAHLYTNTWQFKRTLGGARLVAGQTAGGLITKPSLKMTLNGGYQPVTLELDAEQPPKNLVVDPGFEASDVLADVQVNWTLTTPGEWALMTTATDMHTGRRAIKCTRTNLGPNNRNDSKSTAQKVLPGQTYTASGWMKTSAGAQQSRVTLQWLDASLAAISSVSVTLTGLNPWTFATVSGTAPANAIWAQVLFRGGWWDGVTGANAQTWFDDARLVLGTDKSDPAVNGDLVQLTEQGDPGSTVLFTGILESIADEIDGDSTGRHELVLTPLVAELADTFINTQYIQLVDVAQMVRDAVVQTAHLRFAPHTIGDTGVKALYNFNNTTALDVLNVAKQIAGLNFWWHVDAAGIVWFQAASTASPASLTLKRGPDYKRRKLTPSIRQLKNFVKALGGYPGAATPSGPVAAPITSQYSNAASQKKYGLRAVDPPLVFPTVNDQATLDLIVNTVGLTFDREQNIVEVDLPNLPQRLSLGRPGGLTVRLWEPVLDPYPQPGARGAPGYFGPFVCQDIEVLGSLQKVILGDVPVSGLQDIQYALDQIIQRQALAAAAMPPFFGGASRVGGVVQSAIGGAGWAFDGTKLTAIDPSGTSRLQMGNLPSYTDPSGFTSTAHWGTRTLDAAGKVIADSQGLAGAARVIAAANFSATDTSTVGAWVPATGSAFSFIVPPGRQQNFLAFYSVHGWMAVGNQSGQVRMNINGTVSQRMTFASADGSDRTASGFLFITLPAGQYTATTEISLQGGAGTAHMHEGENVLILMGG